MTVDDRASGWTAAEAEVLAESMMRAPSVHNIQPWRLDLASGEARLYERPELTLPHHDPHGRDRIASCGAALANLELAFRALGRATETTLLPGGWRPELVARVDVRRLAAPSSQDLHRYAAIARRVSHRAPFSHRPVSHALVHEVLGAGAAAGVEARLVAPGRDLAVVAKLLHFAAAKFQADGGYQRELSLWKVRDERTGRNAVGIPASRVPAGSLPW